MQEIPSMPKAIRIEVFYNVKLQEITGVESEVVFMSEGSTFVYLLQNVFMAHPGIEEKYPPGTLGLTINEYPPKPHSPMFDGDKVMFLVH